jgi:serine/threonine protein phosphatase 1
MRTLAIGDIHGSHRALITLLEVVRPKLEDRVVFLGDYVDRGEDSRSVIEYLIRHQEFFSPVFLRGNHEAMMLEGREDPMKATLWQSCGGFETLISYEAAYQKDWPATIPDSHWTFLEQTVRYFETPKHIFVHGGLNSELAMGEQPDWLLFWERFETIQPHKSGRKVIAGIHPRREGGLRIWASPRVLTPARRGEGG